MTLVPGTRVGPYEVVSPLGQGGMGEVYRARDSRLEREVALKVLPPEYSSSQERRERFLREARAVAQLNHPNVLVIHDIGELEGVLYLVTELLAGETLRHRLGRGPVAWPSAVRWTSQIAEGLTVAHEKGIVHRDLKPENLWITRDDRMKILDFGLAKVLQEIPGDEEPTLAGDPGSLTQDGRILGTAGYMSPEQVRGQQVDGRSDIFALGAVLYEMLCGERTFQGPTTMDVLSEILQGEPPRLALPPDCPPAIRGTVTRCLDKDPLRRFSQAHEVASALRALLDPGAAVAKRAVPSVPAVAVLAFKELGDQEDNAHLAIGLADAIITELARSESLVVRPTASSLRYRGAPDPVAAGRQMEVGAVLDGTFQRSGDRLRLTLRLLDVASGDPLWADKIDGSLGDVFALQDEVAARVAEALSVRLGAGGSRAGEELTTGAYELFLEGRVHLYRETVESVHQAITCFEDVRRRDPSFAQAWVGLADAFLRMAFTFEPDGDWYDRAEEMCDRALALDPELPEARYARGRLLWTPRRGFDHVGALRELGAALRGRPGLGEAHLWIGTILFHISLLDEAAQALERALAIDPVDMMSLDMLALTRYYQGRFPEALEMSARAVEKSPTAWGEYQLALCQMQTGELEGAEQRAARGRESFPQSVLFYSVQGLLGALRGDADAAREAIRLVEANRKAFGHYHHAQYDMACIWSLLGEPAAALEALGAAAENGFPCRDFFAIDPLLDGLRDTPELGALLAELDGEVESYRRIYRQAVKGTHLAAAGGAAEGPIDLSTQ